MKLIANSIITTDLCSYGCGNVATYKNGSGNLMCLQRSQSCPAIKSKNRESTKKVYENGLRISGSERYKNLPEETKKRMAWSKNKFLNTKFEYGKLGNHKGFLINERGHNCENCGLSKWLDKPITLELEHIDGNNQNNVKENLKLLCPNCHSFTETWKGKNIHKRKDQYVSDDDFLQALNTTKNIRQALLKLGLTPKGANYSRANELLHGAVVKLANTSGLSPDASV